MHTAELLNIKANTVRAIVKTYVNEGRVEKLPRGGAKRLKVEEMRNALANILDDEPLLTLEEINRKLQRTLPNKPAFTLDKMLYTIKLNEEYNVARNDDQNNEQRFEYGNWFLNHPR